MLFAIKKDEIIWWELRRFLFNAIMLVSGLVLFIGIEIIKPVFFHHLIPSHANYYNGYFDLILFYGILMNVIYSAVYFHFNSIATRFVDIEKQQAAKKFTFNRILIAGVALNVFVGACELYYRTDYLKNIR